MSGHALAARTLLAADKLVRAVAESHGVAAVLFAATAAAAAAVDRGDPP